MAAGLPSQVREHAAGIACASKHLTDLRDRWLNPPEWTEHRPEVVPLALPASPYPDRITARPGFAAALAQRTLTRLCKQRPAWLAQAHAALAAAVAAACGWTDWTLQMPDTIIPQRLLLLLNLQRAAAQPAKSPQ